MENYNLSTTIDKLEYTIYYTDNDPNNIGNPSNLQNQIIEYTQTLLKFLNDIEYIWFIEKFKLNKTAIHNNVIFKGNFEFGDNLAEEWLIVWLMNELSLKFEDLIITLRDTDGEFLLIEFSNELPNTLTPENCENRLFLNSGQLFLLPAEYPKFPHLPPNNFNSFALPLKVQNNFKQKLLDYPNCMKNNLHVSKLELPFSLANLLANKPQLISNISTSYYLRDIDTAKKLNISSYKDQPIKELSVKFNKFSFSMINYQSFSLIPKSIINGFDISTKKMELSLKLILGLELMLLNLKFNDKKFNLEDYKFSNDNNWKFFYDKALETNYFKGNDESSNIYKELLNDLKLSYLNKLINENDNSNNNDNSIDYKEIENILNQPINPNSKFDNSVDDNEDWMEISNSDLDKLFNRKFSNNNENAEEELELEDSDILKLESIQDNLNSYLKIESDFEGIENNDELDLDDVLDSDDYFEKLEFYLSDLASLDVRESDEEEAMMIKELEDKLTNVDLNGLDGNSLGHLLSSVVEEQDQLGPGSILLKQLLEKQ